MSPFGLRIVVSEIDNEPITVKLLKGDGRFTDDRYQKLKPVVVTPEAIEATVAELAASV